MARRKSLPKRKSRAACSPKHATQLETSCVSSRGDENSATGRPSVGRMRKGDGTSTPENDASLGTAENRLTDGRCREERTTVLEESSPGGGKPTEQLSCSTQPATVSKSSRTKSVVVGQTSVRMQSEIQREHIVDQSQSLLKENSRTLLSEEERKASVKWSEADPREKKAAKKTPRRRRYMPTRRTQSKEKKIPKGSQSKQQGSLIGESTSECSDTTLKGRPSSDAVSKESSSELTLYKSSEEFNGQQPEPVEERVPGVKQLTANPKERKAVKKSPRRRRYMPTRRTRSQKKSSSKDNQSKQHRSLLEEEPSGEHLNTPLTGQLSDKLLKEPSNQLPLSKFPEEFSSEHPTPMEESLPSDKQMKASPREKKTLKKTPRRRRYMPTKRTRSRPASKGEKNDCSKAFQSKQHRSPLGGECAGEYSDTAVNGRLSDSRLKGHSHSRHAGATSRNASVLEDACDKSESAERRQHHRKWTKESILEEGPCNKRSKITSNLDDLSIEQTITKPLEQSEQHSRAKPKKTSNSGGPIVASKVRPVSQQPATSSKSIPHTRLPGTSELTGSKPSQASSMQLAPKQAGRQIRSMRKRKADLVTDSCIELSEDELEGSTCRRESGPGKKARMQKPKNNAANQQKIVGKVRVTEWQLSNRITSQWKSISSEAACLIMDVVQSSTGTCLRPLKGVQKRRAEDALCEVMQRVNEEIQEAKGPWGNRLWNYTSLKRQLRRRIMECHRLMDSNDDLQDRLKNRKRQLLISTEEGGAESDGSSGGEDGDPIPTSSTFGDVSVTANKEQFLDKLIAFLEQDRRASQGQSLSHVSST